MCTQVRDEIRVLQRQVVLQIAKEASKDKTVDRTLEENGPAQQIGIGPQQVGQQAVAAAAAPSRHGMMRVTKQAAVGDTDEYGDDTEVNVCMCVHACACTRLWAIQMSAVTTQRCAASADAEIQSAYLRACVRVVTHAHANVLHAGA